MRRSLLLLLSSASLFSAPLEEYAVSGFFERALEGYQAAWKKASSLEEVDLIRFNIGSTYLLQGSPSEALGYLGDVSFENLAPHLDRPLNVNSAIALMREAMLLADEENTALALYLNRAALSLAQKESPGFLRLMRELSLQQKEVILELAAEAQEIYKQLLRQIATGDYSMIEVQRALQTLDPKTDELPRQLLAGVLVSDAPLAFEALALTALERGQKPQRLPYPSGKWVQEAKLFADLSVAALQLARAEKMVRRPFKSLVEASLTLAGKSSLAGKNFLIDYEKDEAAAYKARICLENVSQAVRPLAEEALKTTRDAEEMLKAQPEQFREPQLLMEQVAHLYEQILKQIETLPEETPEEKEKSAAQKVVEMELQDRSQLQPARGLPEVERPW